MSLIKQSADLARNCPVAQGCGHRTLDTGHTAALWLMALCTGQWALDSPWPRKSADRPIANRPIATIEAPSLPPLAPLAQVIDPDLLDRQDRSVLKLIHPKATLGDAAAIEPHRRPEGQVTTHLQLADDPDVARRRRGAVALR